MSVRVVAAGGLRWAGVSPSPDDDGGDGGDDATLVYVVHARVAPLR